MKSSSLIYLLLCLCFGLNCCQQADPKETLNNAIKSEFASQTGTFAMAFHDLTTDETILLNAEEQFHAASTMKTPVMIEVYKKAAAGAFQLTDSILVKNEFYSIVDSSPYQLNPDDDSEKLLYEMTGEKRAIADLVYDMIIVSSNLATNIVIEFADAEATTQTMRDLGAKDIEVLRGVEDIKAFRRGLSNSTTALDLMTIYGKLAKGEVVNPKASEAMIAILKDQKFNEIIPALLPEDVEVAHKTGVITGLHHDSGIVFLPDGRAYVLVLLSKEMDDFGAGTQMMARVSKLVYDYVTAD
ncbi:MAG: serine hydrolase [Bacteroidota bacterium]